MKTVYPPQTKFAGGIINVGGLQKRLHGPDFERFIQIFSLICIQETHFDCFDSIDIQGFKPLPFMIRHRVKCRSGGIAILVKDEYFDKLKFSRTVEKFSIGSLC